LAIIYGGATRHARSPPAIDPRGRGPQASFVIATIMPITTKTTIAIWVQIQNGDIAATAYPRGP